MFYSKESNELSTKDIYFLLTGAITPRPIAWVSTLSKEGRTNIAPFSFFNAFSSNPPIVIFSPAISPDPDRPFKDTYLNLLETKECVVNLVSYALKDQMILSSKDFPNNESEFDHAQIETIDSDLIKAPRVKNSPFQMECRLMEMKKLGDKSGAGNLAICEILKFHINENIFKEGTQRIDSAKADIIGRLGGSNYTRVNEDSIFEIQKP
jgi:flavin reductase (DIM6/NTAB) family NADH-FMN oxidoreductase RutF